MKFQKGHKLARGRPAGSKNKRTLQFLETLEKNNFDAAQALVDLYAKAMEGVQFGNRNEKPIYIKIAADIAKEIAGYVCPKLKAMELSLADPTGQADQARELLQMSDDQLLKAMKERLRLVSGQGV